MAEAEDDAVFSVGAAPIIAQRGELDAAGGGAGNNGRIAQKDRVEATVDGEKLGAIDGAERFSNQVATCLLYTSDAADE